jgi:hypothetical protein
VNKDYFRVTLDVEEKKTIFGFWGRDSGVGSPWMSSIVRRQVEKSNQIFWGIEGLGIGWRAKRFSLG